MVDSRLMILMLWDDIEELDLSSEQLHNGGPLRELAEKLGEGWEGPRLYIGVSWG